MITLFMFRFSGSGVYFGQLDFNPQEVCDNITTETRLLQYPGIDVDCCFNSFNFLQFLHNSSQFIIFLVNLIQFKFIHDVTNNSVVQVNHLLCSGENKTGKHSWLWCCGFRTCSL